MPRDSFGKILLLRLGSLIPLSLTIVFSLIAKFFRRYFCDLGIMNRYSTLAYPQGNGQAKAVDKVIVNGLKKRLDDAKGK